MRKLSLRPYTGNLYVARTIKEYEKQHIALFNEPESISCKYGGRMAGGDGPDGLWTYLVWATSAPYLAHELSHVILAVFERCGIDPRQANGEPFCYLLSQLMMEAI